MVPDSSSEAILECDGITVEFPVLRGAVVRRSVGTVRAVDNVSFAIPRGETLGLVGESGSGKSTIARAVLGLVRPNRGTVRFDGVDVGGLSGSDRKRMRRQMQMIFQDPYGSLNPRLTIERLVGEPLDVHRVGARGDRRKRVHELLETVGLDRQSANRYPHEFSGGQRQRIGIARALAAGPSLVVCDEPVSSLDVSIQAQIVNLLQDLQRNFGLSYLFIGHDLSVVRHIAQRVAVMYRGAIVEVGSRERVYGLPLHPYTIGLLSAVSDPDPSVERHRRRIVLSGEIPTGQATWEGCRFRSRCWLYEQLDRPARCVDEDPDLREFGPGHSTACHFGESLIESDSRDELIARASRNERTAPFPMEASA